MTFLLFLYVFIKGDSIYCAPYRVGKHTYKIWIQGKLKRDIHKDHEAVRIKEVLSFPSSVPRNNYCAYFLFFSAQLALLF